MKCLACGNENPGNAQFCGRCSSILNVRESGAIEMMPSKLPLENCPECGNDVKPDTFFCGHCGKRLLHAQNPSGGSAGRTIAGILIGLAFGLVYGFLPGYIVVLVLAESTKGFLLPGYAYAVDESSFAAMAIMFIAIFFGLVIFPIVGGVYGSRGWNPLKKKRLVLIALLIHVVLSYGTLLALDNLPPTEEEQPPPQESSTSTLTPTPRPTATPYPTPEGLNYYKQGEQYLWQDENYVKAVESFTDYIDLNPNDARGYQGRGDSYHHLAVHSGNDERIDSNIILGHFQEALKDYDKAIELNTENPSVYGQRGHVRRLLGQYQDAIKDYDKQIELDPSNPWPHHYKGMTYRELEQYELAIQSWERHIEVRLIESDNWIESEQAADAYTNIGLAYIELSQYQKAIERFDKVLKIAPNYSDALRGKEKATENLK